MKRYYNKTKVPVLNTGTFDVSQLFEWTKIYETFVEKYSFIEFQCTKGKNVQFPTQLLS